MRRLYVLCFLFFAASTSAAPVLTLSLASNTVMAGEDFNVDVLASGIGAGDQLLGFGFDVFNGPGSTYQGASVGLDFNDISASFPNTEVAGSAFPPIYGDDILLASLTFTAGGIAGTWSLGVAGDTLSSPLSEGLITELNAYDFLESTNVTVEVVPLPAAAWLFISALGGLGIMQRFRQSKGALTSGYRQGNSPK